MDVKERIALLQLDKLLQKNLDFAKLIGVSVKNANLKQTNLMPDITGPDT